jgi:rRNA-processing protein FCF1
MGREMSVSDDELLSALGLEPKNMIVYTSDRKLVDNLTIRQIGKR